LGISRWNGRIGDKVAAKWERLVRAGVFPAEAVTQAVINDMTESGVGGGIEQAYSDWVSAGGMEELEDMPDGSDDS
jgi:hypothetical protein